MTLAALYASKAGGPPLALLLAPTLEGASIRCRVLIVYPHRRRASYRLVGFDGEARATLKGRVCGALPDPRVSPVWTDEDQFSFEVTS